MLKLLQTVRTYHCKTQWGQYEKLRHALEAVCNGTAIKTASMQYGFQPKTVRHHRDGKVSKPGEKLNLAEYQLCSRSWNMDETGISSVHKSVKILATKGARSVGRSLSLNEGRQ